MGGSRGVLSVFEIRVCGGRKIKKCLCDISLGHVHFGKGLLCGDNEMIENGVYDGCLRREEHASDR
jgi:hypothetical protein